VQVGALKHWLGGAFTISLFALVGDPADHRRPGVTVGNLATARDIGGPVGALLDYGLLSVAGFYLVYLLSIAALTVVPLAAVWTEL
jgi:hypothetical protein